MVERRQVYFERCRLLVAIDAVPADAGALAAAGGRERRNPKASDSKPAAVRGTSAQRPEGLRPV